MPADFDSSETTWKKASIRLLISRNQFQNTTMNFISLHKDIMIQKLLLTFPQLLPATKHDTSPPIFFAAVRALSVIGVSLLLSCSAITSVDCRRLPTVCVHKCPLVWLCKQFLPDIGSMKGSLLLSIQLLTLNFDSLYVITYNNCYIGERSKSQFLPRIQPNQSSPNMDGTSTVQRLPWFDLTRPQHQSSLIQINTENGY